MLQVFQSSKFRQWLYGIVLLAVPILVVYGVIEDQAAPLWIALGSAILGQGTALGAVTIQRNAGILADSEPAGRTADALEPDETQPSTPPLRRPQRVVPLPEDELPPDPPTSEGLP